MQTEHDAPKYNKPILCHGGPLFTFLVLSKLDYNACKCSGLYCATDENPRCPTQSMQDRSNISGEAASIDYRQPIHYIGSRQTGSVAVRMMKIVLKIALLQHIKSMLPSTINNTLRCTHAAHANGRYLQRTRCQFIVGTPPSDLATNPKVHFTWAPYYIATEKWKPTPASNPVVNQRRRRLM